MIGWFEKKRYASILFVVLITLEIFFFSSIPGSIGGTGNVWIPRIYHFTVFFLFSFFLFMAIKGDKKIKTKYILIVLIISLIHSALDEFHQKFVPLRNMSIGDFLTDSLGVFLSVILYAYISKKTRKKRN